MSLTFGHIWYVSASPCIIALVSSGTRLERNGDNGLLLVGSQSSRTILLHKCSRYLSPPSSYNYNRAQLPLLAPCHGLLPFSFMPQTGLESVFPLGTEVWAGNTGKRREFRKMCPSSPASPSKSLLNELRQSNAAAAAPAAAAAGHTKTRRGEKRGARSRVRTHKPGRLCPEVCVRPLVCASLLRSHQ